MGAGRIPPPLERPHNTRQSANAHRYSVSIANSRVNSFDNFFFLSTSKLWNSLPESVFPNSYNLSSFKRQVCHHLRGGSNVFIYVALLISLLQPKLDKGIRARLGAAVLLFRG